MNLYHSFPRNSLLVPERELEEGMAALEAMLRTGLLLTFENVIYPLIGGDVVDVEGGSFAPQLRTCFTLLHEAELEEHGSHFGPFSLEFDVDTLRRLGAFPVTYIPQPLRRDSGRYYEASIIGNNIVHQLRDVAILLEEIVNLQAQIDQNTNDLDSVFYLEAKRKPGITTLRNIDIVLDYLLGNKCKFDNLLNAVIFLARTFYHADSARKDIIMLESDLNYYLQREWRIVSGLLSGGEEIDSLLSADDVALLAGSFEYLRRIVKMPDGEEKSHLSVARKVPIFGASALASIKRIFVPDVVLGEVSHRLGLVGIRPEMILPLNYDKILSIRASRAAGARDS